MIHGALNQDFLAFDLKNPVREGSGNLRRNVDGNVHQRIQSRFRGHDISLCLNLLTPEVG
jgi:hypothetical protein